MNINLFEEYTLFAHNVFNYCKNTILKDFPSVQLEISYDQDMNNKWGCNTFNRIYLFMYGFVDEFFGNRLYVKNRILWALLHESIHQLQAIDIGRYRSDKEYAKFVERNTDYSTGLYINDHIQELQNNLNIIVYEYEIDKILDTYKSRNAICIDERNTDYKYFNNLINRFIKIDLNTSYQIYLKYHTIRFHFILNDGTKLDQITIRENFVMDFKNINKIIKNYMYYGYGSRIEKVKSSENNNGEELIYSIYMNNKNIQFMRRD